MVSLVPLVVCHGSSQLEHVMLRMPVGCGLLGDVGSKVCQAGTAQEDSAVPSGPCKITCFGSLSWPFGSLLCPQPLDRNNATQHGCKALQPQKGDLRV